jgi:hypothetical protein
MMKSKFAGRTGMLGFVIQMWTLLMASLERERIFLRISERSPLGPPSARHALASLPYTELMMLGV